MFVFVSMQGFCRHLLDQEELAEKAGTIMQATLEAHSPRLSDLSHRVQGNPAGNWKMLQRFLQRADPVEALRRLYWSQVPLVLADPTEIPRPHADPLGISHSSLQDQPMGPSAREIAI